MGLSGLTYLVQGWVVGSEGFSETHTILILVAWVLTLGWMIWLVVIAWRMPDSLVMRRSGFDPQGGSLLGRSGVTVCQIADGGGSTRQRHRRPAKRD
jgi:hypothetical protein